MSGVHWFPFMWLVVGLTLGITSTAMPNWYNWDFGNGTSVYFGLWEICASRNEPRSGYDETACDSWNYLSEASPGELDTNWLQACEGLMITACIFNAIAAMTSCRAINNGMQASTVKRMSIAAGLAGGLYVAAVITFGTNLDDADTNQGNLYVGFGLAIAAAIVNYLSYFVNRKVARNDYVAINEGDP